MSVAAIQARIAQIHSRFPAPPTTTPAAPGRFSAALSTAVDASAPAPQTAAATTPSAATTTAAATTTSTTALREPWSPAPRLQTAPPSAPHVHNHVGAPPDLAKYGNGKIPPAALTEIGGGHRLWQPAAENFKRLMAEAEAAGITIGVTDSYRSYEQQVDLAERKGLYSQGGLAATPGTSNHGWGKSLDLDLNDEAQAWMRANGERYGFVEDVPREPWHWTYGAHKG